MSRNDALLGAFAAELRSRRAKAGLSQESLALLAEVNRTYVAKLELARNQPSLTVLHNLAIALDLDLTELIHGVLARYHRSMRVSREAKRKT